MGCSPNRVPRFGPRSIDGRVGPPYEPRQSDTLLCFRAAVLAVEYRGPPNPLPKERQNRLQRYFDSKPARSAIRNVCAPSPWEEGWGEGDKWPRSALLRR